MKWVPDGIRKPLRHTNYRYFLTGQAASVFGYWMQMIAMSWLVYDLTKSSLVLGTVSFFATLPALIISPFAGMIADRYCKKYILYFTQFASFAISALLTIDILLGKVEIWHVMAYALSIGTLMAFENPTRNAFIVEMVGKEDLQSAIALNSTVFNMGRLIGPALAGFLIPFTGVGFVFALNALSYLSICYALFKITTMGYPSTAGNAEAPLKALVHGFEFAFVHKGIFFALILLGLGSLFNSPLTALLPIYAVEILNGDSSTLGLLTAAVGMGALAAALMLTSLSKSKDLLKWLASGTCIFVAGMYGVTFAENIWLVLFTLSLTGYGMVMQMATINTLIQLLTPDEYRGRIMSLFSMMMIGMGTFGSLLGGTSGEIFGIRYTLLFSALGLTFGLVFLLPHLLKSANKELR